MLAILCAHAVATALAPLLVSRYGRMAFYPLALVPLGSLVCVALNWPGSDVAGQPAPGSDVAGQAAPWSDVAGQAAPWSGRGTSVNIEWLPELSMNITLRFRSEERRVGKEC